MFYILWAIPKGKSDRLDEKLLVSEHAEIRDKSKLENFIKTHPDMQNWHSFRIVPISEMPEMPDFTKTINL